MKIDMEILEDLFINVEFEKIAKFAKLAGVSFNSRQDVITQLKTNVDLQLKRDYTNQYDKNAIGAYYGNDLIGWIPRYLAEKLAPEMDLGINWDAKIINITGVDKQNKGVNIELNCIL